MKLKTVIRLAVIVSVISLCTGFAVFSFLRLSATNNQQDFDLYALVPQDATAILETDRMADLVGDINGLNCSKDNHYLYVSELFVYLKKHLHTLMEGTPHGLSREMDKMLISFHDPDTPYNQVLYCTLGTGDYELIESFIQKYCSSVFPSKYFDYKGEEIRIYPMEDGHFLAAYVTSDFLVVSFQKRLIEQVIDSYRDKKSLVHLPSFIRMHTGKQRNVPATVYMRMKSVDMGKETDGIRSSLRLGSWAEFDLTFSGDAIYCSGTSYGVDSTKTFINALRQQQPVEGFMGEYLPSSTFFYNRWSISNNQAMLDFTSCQEYARSTYSNYIKDRDEELIAFLKDHAGQSVMACLFLSKDTLQKSPCSVMSISVKDVPTAEHRLQEILRDAPTEADERPLFRIHSTVRHTPTVSLRRYMLPRNTLLTQMTGITESALYTYVTFYRDNLLLAPDAASLSAYIQAVENGDVMDGKPVYEESIGSLSSAYNFLLTADMERMVAQPETYVRLIPSFFFRQANFFRHFLLSVQFTCVDGVVYPNIVLVYKGDK